MSLGLCQKKSWLQGHPRLQAAPGHKPWNSGRVGGAEVQVKGGGAAARIFSSLSREDSAASHQVLEGGTSLLPPPLLWIGATGMQQGSSLSLKGQISAGTATSPDKQMDFQGWYKVQS